MTDGTAITLSVNGSGVVVGTVGADAAHPGFTGQVAFAITIDPVTGEMYVAQYLSLHQDSLTTTPNDFVTLAADTLGVTVRLTDGDGDQVTSVATDVSNHVQFADDGPTTPVVTVSDGSVTVDETPGVQTAADPNPANDVLSTAVPAAILAKFDAIGASRGVDTDVAPAALDDGALSFAASAVTGGASAPPELDLDANNSSGGGSNYTSTFTIGGPAVPIADIDVAITDPDSTTIASATISTIGNGQTQPNDTLSISGILPGGITASAYNPATGVLTLTGVASIADYEAALHQVVFSATDPLFNADRIISVTVNDGAHTSNTAQTFMHVASVGQAATDVIDHSGSLVSLGTLNFGADGPAGGTVASGTSYALKVTTAGIFSGLQTTEGHDVFLYLQTTEPTAGLILGRVGIEASGTPGLDTADPNGKVAFALAIDPASGEVYIADYLSLHNPLAGSTPAAHDDQITLASNTVGVVVTLTDGDGDTISTPGTDVSSQIRFQDDGPTAHVDSGNVNEGALLTVAAAGVLSNDVAGADGFAAGGGVVGVRAAGGDLTTDVTTGVNAPIAGLHGTLHLNADGSYTYQSTANNITANTTDVFVYTIKDGDGDLSTTTLTINLANVTLVADNQTKTVNEAALDTVTDPGDLGHGTVTGSNPTSTAETVTGALAVAGATGYVAQSVTGTHGLFQLNADGTYTYTLTSAVTESPASNNGTDTVNGVESFSYTAHDASNNTVTGTITINVIDDVPTAHVDSGNVAEGGLLTVAAAGVLSNDIAGADGFAAGGGVVGVRAAGNDLTTDVTTGVNTPIAGPARHARSACQRQLHLPVDGEQHHGGHHRRVCLHDQGRRWRSVDDDADDQPCQCDAGCGQSDEDRERGGAGYGNRSRRPRSWHGYGFEPGIAGRDGDGHSGGCGRGGLCGAKRHGHARPVPTERGRHLHLYADQPCDRVACVQQRRRHGERGREL